MGKREREIIAIIFFITIWMSVGNKVLPSLTGSTVYLYIVKPLFWLALSCYVWNKPKCRFKGKLKLQRFILIWSAIFGIVHLSVYFAGGFIDGIGASPYAKNLKGILMNMWGFGSVIIMMEWVRNYAVNRVKKKFVFLFSAVIVVVFALCRLNLRILAGIQNWQQAIQYMGEFAFPEIMNSILLTYIVYIGGAYPAMIYTAITSFPVWLSPVLPDLTWITKAFIGIITPVAFIIILRQEYKKKSKEIKLREQKTEKPYSWISVSIISIAIIWFAVGVFPVFPTVILTGSMEPVIYPGDVAIMQKMDGNKVKKGDVIQYWTGEVFVIHRIIDIDESGRFRTKGDNNSAPDTAPVTTGQVKGKMLTVIPKIGIVSIIFKTVDKVPREQVGF
jgi:signal peptidase I